MMLKKKKSMFTGAGQGIGKAIALELASQGADVTVCDLNADTVRETASAVQERNVQALALTLDVADNTAVVAGIEESIARFGRIDILVNNAGWDDVMPFVDTGPELWGKVIAINYKGVIHFCHAVAKHMMEHKSGRIVNVASDAGRVGSLGETVYAGAKGAVIAFTKSLAREMARFGINVNCVCPGPTDTELFRSLPEKVRQGLERAIPLRRVAKPEEIAQAAVFFASPMSDYITGQVLSVSGGLTMSG